jgi:anti-sigma regulatory factor (Ser/Thr protein kinase)
MAAATTVTLRNSLSEIARLPHAVESFGSRHALPTRLIFEVNLALEEIVTNVISYAYDDDADHDIVVRLTMQAGELAVQVEDDGRAFNPLEVVAPLLDVPLHERPIGGLGVHLVRKLADAVEYRRQDATNILVITKRVG